MSVTTTFPSNFSHKSLDSQSGDSTVQFLISISFNITRLSFLIPLSIFILYLGYQQWRQQHSFQPVSHFDIFTYHLAAIELSYCLGTVLYYCGIYLKLSNMVRVGSYFSNVILCGETCFHILTCVERYLAVVHPITYRALRNTRGVKIRNRSIGFVWLLCFVWSYITTPTLPVILTFCFMVFSLAIVSYCSLYILCALIHPGKGEGAGKREQVNQSKQRAFYTVMAIMGMTCLLLLGIIVTTAVNQSSLLSNTVKSMVVVLGFWLNIPSCLVLPLLYLQRKGKLSYHCNTG